MRLWRSDTVCFHLYDILEKTRLSCQRRGSVVISGYQRLVIRDVDVHTVSMKEFFWVVELLCTLWSWLHDCLHLKNAQNSACQVVLVVEGTCQCRRCKRCRFNPGVGIGTPPSILAWKIPWAKEPGMLQSMRSQAVGHNWETEHSEYQQQTYCTLKYIFITSSSSVSSH